MAITAPNLALMRTPSGRVLPEGGASAAPVGGKIHSAPGRLGHHACRHYDRRARCIAVTGNGACGTPQLSRRFREAWPDAEPSGRKSRWREPRWNAGRRARPQAEGGASRLTLWRVPHAACVRATDKCVCRRSASLFFAGSESIRGVS
jgi:hypothetical protein